MQYQISAQTRKKAELPHSLFTLNLIIVHLFASYTMLELGYEQKIIFIPFVSMLILAALWFKAKQQRTDNTDWFVAAHWLLMTKRTHMLIIFYIVGLVLAGFTFLMVGMSPLKGGDVTTIALRMGAVPIFLGLLVTFVLSGGSIYDAQRGVIGQKIVNQFPAPSDITILTSAEGAGDSQADTHPQDH